MLDTINTCNEILCLSSKVREEAFNVCIRVHDQIALKESWEKFHLKLESIRGG
jgi:predicted transposase YbfD/YdcC